MHATINLADKRQFRNLLHVVFALHDSSTHDVDTVTFRRDDGFTLQVNFSVDYVSFGREDEPEGRRRWTENIGIGTIDELLMLFIHGQDDDLRRFPWLVTPPPTKPRTR